MSFELFERERAAGRELVAAFVVATEGSTYRKPGAYMSFARDGAREGLLSGGCLEADLGERATRLLDSRRPIDLASYDSRTSDDPIWGLGLGCEGLMRIALLRVGPAHGWEPLATLQRCARDARRAAIAFVVDEASAGVAAGAVAVSCEGSHGADRANAQPGPDSTQASSEPRLGVVARERLRRGGAGLEDGIFSMGTGLAPMVLICGAGPDAEPVVEWGARLGWRVAVVDHRPAYLADASRRFPAAARNEVVEPAQLGRLLEFEHIAAAVVMSHHLVADRDYLATLADARVPYVGLLGPAARRERLIAEIGRERAARLAPRLRAPIGLDLGGGTPESIALSIVAEIQATLCGRDARPFSAPRPAQGL